MNLAHKSIYYNLTTLIGDLYFELSRGKPSIKVIDFILSKMPEKNADLIKELKQRKYEL
jgi:hypothetical protein